MGEKTTGGNEKATSEAMSIVADKAPVTRRRKVAQDLDAKLPKPCTYNININQSSFFLARIIIIIMN